MQTKKILAGHGVFITDLANARKIHLNTVRNALKRYRIPLRLMPGTKFPYRHRQAVTNQGADHFGQRWAIEHP
jgi:hypothetical protein